MTTDDAYTTAELAKETGFTMRQLDYWARQRLLIPSVQSSMGSGNHRLYGIENLIQLRFIRRLKDAGWSTQKIRTAITTLQIILDDPNPLRSAILIHGKATILALCKTSAGERILLDALSTGGQHAMGIVLEMLAEEAYQLGTQLHTTQMTNTHTDHAITRH